jgi:hypothetical protein
VGPRPRVACRRDRTSRPGRATPVSL